MNLLRNFFFAGCLMGSAIGAFAQPYPNQPVKVLLPFPPGGGTDTITRALTEPLGRILGQSVVMDYRPGGNTIIGTSQVASAKPDGYTLLATMDMTATILPAVYHKLPFDPSRDLTPVALLAKVPALFVVHPSIPANNLKELVEYSKAHPNKITYGSAVLYGQLLGESLKALGMSYVHVPYKGSAEAITSLVGGHVDMMMIDIATGIQFLKDGRVKALAITAPHRHPQLPGTPTVGEQGWPELEMSVWYGLFAPKGTPPEVIDRLNKGVAQVISDPAVVKKLADLGHDVEALSPGQLAELQKRDAAKWLKAARDGNVRLD